MMNYTHFADETLAKAIARRNAFTDRARKEDAAKRRGGPRGWFGRHASRATTHRPTAHAA